mmetsp:Transcript_29198/g.33897  ORF Transcript_29198/g.33897 Transcript_29198/m.33897 type:complete len:88 (-) Transcript_29198:358-621(-)
MSNFVDSSRTMPSCNMSERNIPSDVSTDDANPDGETGFLHKKLPTINEVVIAGETVQSIFSPSSLLFNKICALRLLDDWKNSTASAS